MASDLDAEPTADDVRELYDHNRTEWTTERNTAEMLTDLYWGEHALKVTDTAARGRKRKIEPERMETKECARIADLIASLYATPASIGLHWTGEGERSGAKDGLELALNETIDQLNPPDDSPRERRVFSQVLLGRSAQLGPMYGGAYYWDFP
ncbi:hypothetical protein LCGC14_1734790, partial [marine sediment metagenome]